MECGYFFRFVYSGARQTHGSDRRHPGRHGEAIGRGGQGPLLRQPRHFLRPTLLEGRFPLVHLWVWPWLRSWPSPRPCPQILPSRAYSEFKRCEEICYDVISKLVDAALQEESDTCQQDAVRSIFMSILRTAEVDVRDKKAAIIDFIAAGIKTVGIKRQSQSTSPELVKAVLRNETLLFAGGQYDRVPGAPPC